MAGVNEYLITERPGRALIKFAVPMMIGGVLQELYGLVDSVLVGRFVSQTALASIGACGNLTAVFVMIAMGAGIGSSVPVSGRFGERRYGPMRQAVSTSIIGFIVFGCIISLIGLVFSRTFLTWLRTPEDVMPMAVTYLKIYFCGFPFLFLYNVLSSMFNAVGDSRTPLMLLVFSTLLNIVLDVWMIGSLGMGVAGAALATIIAQGAAAVLSLGLFIRRARSWPNEPHRRFSGRDMNLIWRFAAPSIIQQSTISIGILLVQSAVNPFGSAVLAGYSCGGVIFNLCTGAICAICGAMTPYTSQNMGAGRHDRISMGLRAGYRIVIVICLICTFIVEVFHDPIIHLFLGSRGTPEAWATARGYMTFVAWFFIFIGLKQATDGVIRGLGYMQVFMIANLVNLSIRVSVAMICAPRFGVEFVWYAVPIGWLANFLISYWEYRRKKPEWSRGEAPVMRENTEPTGQA